MLTMLYATEAEEEEKEKDKEESTTMVETESVVGSSVAEPKKPSVSYYSKEHKLKRYYGILRDFMAYFHQHGEAYPVDHEVCDPLFHLTGYFDGFIEFILTKLEFYSSASSSVLR